MNSDTLYDPLRTVFRECSDSCRSEVAPRILDAVPRIRDVVKHLMLILLKNPSCSKSNTSKHHQKCPPSAKTLRINKRGESYA
jgi:hypothetical protein